MPKANPTRHSAMLRVFIERLFVEYIVDQTKRTVSKDTEVEKN